MYFVQSEYFCVLAFVFLFKIIAKYTTYCAKNNDDYLYLLF